MHNRGSILFIILALFLTLFFLVDVCLKLAHSTSFPADQEDQPTAETQQPTSLSDPAAELLAGMTLHEKLCQMFVVYPEAITSVSAAVQAGDTTRQALESWPVGGFLYDAKNMLSQQQLKEMLDTTQSYAKIPMFFTCDEEGGRVARLMSTVGTTRIGPMLQYQNDGPETARANARTIAADLLSCGFNMDFAPVADVWSNPENTIIGDRAYSDDFSQAAELISSAVQGFHDEGVLCTLKHFPGHGDTSLDSHYGAVYVYKTLEQLRAEEFLPFKAGIDAGADLVMMGHLIIPDIDTDPAPFSYQITTELLREELGFAGVIITDSLQMQAMTDHYTSGEIAVNAVAAGVDMLLCPKDLDEAVSSLAAAIEDGTLSEARINESVYRILSLKIRAGLLEQ